MASFKERLNSIKDTKNRIKDKLIQYEIDDPGDVLSAYPSKIRQIKNTINIEGTNSLNGYTCNGIAYGNGVYVAATNSTGKALYSYDTNYWYESYLPGGYSLNFVSYLGGKFVASGSSGAYLLMSDDGITWSSSYSFGSYGMTSCIYANNTYLVGKYTSSTSSTKYNLYSTDGGSSWTETLTGVRNKDGWLAGYVNNTYLMVYKGSNSYYYSTDLTTWTAVTSITGLTSAQKVCFSPNRLLTIGSSGTGVYTDDGTTWTYVTLPSSGTYTDLIYTGSEFVAIDNNGVYSSVDGVTWTTHTGEYPTNGYTCYKENKNLLVGSYPSGSITYSKDKSSWYTNISKPAYTAVGTKAGEGWLYDTLPSDFITVKGIMYRDNKFILYGGSQVAFSSDGFTWDIHSVSINITEMHYCNGYYISGVSYSTDCLTWTTLTLPSVTTNAEYDATITFPKQGKMQYVGGKFVVVGYYYEASNYYWYGYAYRTPAASSWTTVEKTWGYSPIYTEYVESADIMVVGIYGTTADYSYQYYDGSSWSSWSDTSSNYIHGFFSLGDKLWEYGGSNSSSTSIYQYTIGTDKSLTQNGYSTLSTTPTSIAYNGSDKYIVVNSSNEDSPFYYSSTGKTWVNMYNRPKGTNWSSIAYGAGKFLVVNTSTKKIAYTAVEDTYTILHRGSTIVPSFFVQSISGYTKNLIDEIDVYSSDGSLSKDNIDCILEGDKLYISYSSTTGCSSLSLINSPGSTLYCESNGGNFAVITVPTGLPLRLYFTKSGTTLNLEILY